MVMKFNSILSTGAVITTMLMMCASCGDLGDFINPGGDDNDGTDIPGIELPGIDKPTEELDTEEQKLKLEQVGIKLMDKCPSGDVMGFFDLYDAFVEAYIDKEGYDLDALEVFAENVAEKSFTEEEERLYNELKKQYSRKSVYSLTVALSNHTGEFTFGRNAVKRTSGSTEGVKVNFSLDGKDYVAELKSSGKVTRAVYDYRDFYENTYDSGYMDSEGNWVYVGEGLVTMRDFLFKFTIDVPEKIEISLKENGIPMAEITFNFKQSFTASGLNPTTDNFNVEGKVVLDGGYEINISNVSYDGAGQTAGGGVVVIKDGQALVTGLASGQVSLENFVDRYEDRWDDEYYSKGEWTSVKVNKAKEVGVAVDVLGEVQFKGSCSNAKEVADLMESYWDALSDWDEESDSRKNPDEAAALRHLNNINAKLDLNVYYDRGNNSQAKVEFEIGKEVRDWDMNGDGYVNSEDIDYFLLPVIVFNDGSRYAFEDYFTKAAFKALIDRVDEFAEEYDDLFGIYDSVLDVPLEEHSGSAVNPSK